jgi:hypothetical protein
MIPSSPWGRKKSSLIFPDQRPDSGGEEGPVKEIGSGKTTQQSVQAGPIRGAPLIG